MKKIIILIIAIILVLIITGVVILFLFKKNANTEDSAEKILDKILKEKYSHGELVEIRYKKDGSYHGGVDHIEAYKEEDGYKLVIEYAQERYEGIDVSEYKITEEDFKELEDYIIKYNLPSWDKFGPPLYEELDGDFQDLTIVFNENDRKKYYTIDYSKNIPIRGYQILREFTEKMQSFKKDENIIKEYKREDV